MKTLCTILTCIVFIAVGQRKIELQEMKGTFKEMRSGYYFAYEVLLIDMGGETRLFRIDPIYGHAVLKKLKPGMQLIFKAWVDDKAREAMRNIKGNPVYWASMFGEGIESVYLNGVWIPTPAASKDREKRGFDWAIILEQSPVDEILEDKTRKGLIFMNGLIGFSSFADFGKYSIKDVQIGKPISFMGYESLVRPDYLYPIENVMRVVSFIELKKTTGKIESFIYKQNFARIGLKLNGERFNFPAEYAQTLQDFSTKGTVTIYYHGDWDERSNLLPSIQAVIQGKDTLRISSMYYGDPDGKHDYRPIDLEGKITSVNRSEKGRILNIIMGNDCYVEIDPRTADQLGSYLSKGKTIKVSGLERVKKDGEIYERNYRIVTPRKMEADGKEFILNR